MTAAAMSVIGRNAAGAMKSQGPPITARYPIERVRTQL